MNYLFQAQNRNGQARSFFHYLYLYASIIPSIEYKAQTQQLKTESLNRSIISLYGGISMPENGTLILFVHKEPLEIAVHEVLSYKHATHPFKVIN